MPFTHRKVANTVGLILVAIAIVSLFFSWHASAEEKRSNDRLKAYVQCQADWTNFLFQAINENRNASNTATQALDNLINTVATAKSPSETRAALAAYQKARVEQKDAQTKHPLPPAPKTVCQLEDK